jgi:serine phosphatase RsbU (regulator of sigma subunit)
MKKLNKASLFAPRGSAAADREAPRPIEQTTRMAISNAAKGAPRLAPPAHFLVPVDSPERPVRVGVGPPLIVGRSADCGVVLEDRSVSGRHCVVTLREKELWVEDLGSTNGSRIDGKRIEAPTLVPVGSLLQVGNVKIRHELRDEQSVADDAEWSGELKSASRYITDLLPAPGSSPSLAIEWRLVPCRRLGGDSLGYFALDDHRTAIYLVDVCGHGLRAALHSVAILNTLRQRSLPADYSDPGAVLVLLNRAFPMEAHGGMYFTMWYGVVDVARRTLRWSSAGHPPAILREGEAPAVRRLELRRPPIGILETTAYPTHEVALAPDARLYVFSDGVYEELAPDGRILGLDWLEDVLLEQHGPLVHEPERVESALRAATSAPRFQDDFTLLVAHTP